MAALPEPALAQSYCPAPSEPFCVGYPTSFQDGASFDLCLRAVESYQAEVERLLDCLHDNVRSAYAEADRVARDAERDQQQALAAHDDVIAEFNCRASGESYC